MATKVGINGFGRISRNVLRAATDDRSLGANSSLNTEAKQLIALILISLGTSCAVVWSTGDRALASKLNDAALFAFKVFAVSFSSTRLGSKLFEMLSRFEKNEK